MPFIAKLNPEDFLVTEFAIRLPERSPHPIEENAEIFVWTVETAGGSGLIGRITTCTASSAAEPTGFSSLMLVKESLVGKDQLQPYRDVNDGTLLSFLANKLYFFSNRRTLEIPDDHALALRRRFVDHLLLG